MSQQKQIKYYKKISRTYDKKPGHVRENRNHLNKLQAICEYLDIKPGSKILEIGVGTGIHAKYILKWFKDKNIKFTGIDISPDMLQLAKKRLGATKAIELCQMNGENLGFPDNYFDSIYMTATLHHFDDLPKGIGEVVRCLKPGGKFALMEPGLYWPKNLYQGLFIPEEKNQMLIKKKNFRKWFSKYPNIRYQMVNMAFTPPFPKRMISLYNKIDSILSKIPILKEFSIQLYVKGQKDLE